MDEPERPEAVFIVDPDEETPEGAPAESTTPAAVATEARAPQKDMTSEARQKFYQGMIEGFDIYGAQFPQEEVNYNPLGATAERGCANCRWFISPNACLIVEAFPQPITANGLSDKWEVKKVRLGEPLRVTIVDEQGSSHDDADKATKTEGGVEFPSSDYAVVPDSEKPSGWKLRLAEGSPGNQTVAQVGRAITALQPGGFRGQRVQLSSEEKTTAISKIGGAIGRLSGATTDQKDNLRERLDAVKSRTLQVTVPSRMVKVVKDLLGRLTLKPDDEAVRPFVIFKDTKGDLRWFAWTTNKWRDRDNPPEILSDKAHRDYVAWVDETQNYPEAWLWHTPGSKWGQADWVEYADGFVMVSGTVDPGMEHVADALALQKDLGVSHGFRYRHGDESKGIIDWYRTFEISPLPISAAANPWTSLEVIQKEIDMSFSAAKRAFLEDKLGADQVTRLETDTGAMKAALEAKGVDWKDVPDADDETPTTQVVNNLSIGEESMKALADAAGTAAATALIETPAFKDMVVAQADVATQLKGIAERLDELEKTDDQKIADAVAGRSHRTNGHVASTSKDNTLTDEEKEQAKKDGGPTILDQIVEEMVIGTPVA